MWSSFLLLCLSSTVFSLLDCGVKMQYLPVNQVAPFILPGLPYPYDFLAPVLSPKQIYIHHDKHVQKYVDSLNSAVAANQVLSNKNMLQMFTGYSDVLKVQKFAGGVYNHLLYFWTLTAPQCSGAVPANSTLSNAINAKWGSFAGFKTAFNAAATDVFGSGWTWLCANETGLLITNTWAQRNPLMIANEVHCLPFLTLDMWEHAYYIQYVYKRDSYVDHWWRSVDWNLVSYFYDTYVSQSQAVPF